MSYLQRAKNGFILHGKNTNVKEEVVDGSFAPKSCAGARGFWGNQREMILEQHVLFDLGTHNHITFPLSVFSISEKKKYLLAPINHGEEGVM